MVAVNEEDATADDIEQFVAQMIVQPPPPLNCDDSEDISETYCRTSYTDNINNNDVIVTSAGTGRMTSDHDVNNESSVASSVPAGYPRAGSIDKTTDLYVNLPKSRPRDLPPLPPLLQCSTYPRHYVNSEARLQTTVNDDHCQYSRRSLQWYDALYDSQHSSTDDQSHRHIVVCPTTSLRPVSLQHE